MERAFHGVDIVIHAAALKQVPACEYNPFEAIQTNVMGAKNIIDAAIDQGVKTVVAFSTDKAVNPGEPLRRDEIVRRKNFLSRATPTPPAAARGSVASATATSSAAAAASSRCSCSSARRGKITVTDERMTRFWITLEQGVHSCIKAAEQMHGRGSVCSERSRA